MSTVLLSYIVPVYNTAPYLGKCLQSLVNQGLQHDEYEIIAVDDGSSDNSREVIENFAKDYPQVRLITQANAGVSAARNKALDLAQGRFVQFVDSDDYLEPNVMGPLLRRAVNENLDVIMFNFKWVDANGGLIKVSKPRDDMRTTPVMGGAEFLEKFTLMQYVCWYLVSLEHLNRLNLRFDTSLIACEDGALAAQFLLHARRVAFSEVAPYCYVSRSDSAMNNTNRDHLRRRIFSQIDAAALIDRSIKEYEAQTGGNSPASVAGLRNLYLFFSMTKSLTCGCVDEAVAHMRELGLYPFPCIGYEINYDGKKWKILHGLMMHPKVWALLSRVYGMVRN